jgi:metal-responsive CopG/Arc/MetJ family transcriptional regulator
MKTAISLPKDVFEKAERLATRARKSRSQLFCQALREYISRHSPDEVTESLNRIFEETEPPDKGFVTTASALALKQVEW